MSERKILGLNGRLVIPKSIRDELDLREGSVLELEIKGGKILIRILER